MRLIISNLAACIYMYVTVLLLCTGFATAQPPEITSYKLYKVDINALEVIHLTLNLNTLLDMYYLSNYDELRSSIYSGQTFAIANGTYEMQQDTQTLDLIFPVTDNQTIRLFISSLTSITGEVQQSPIYIEFDVELNHINIEDYDFKALEFKPIQNISRL